MEMNTAIPVAVSLLVFVVWVVYGYNAIVDAVRPELHAFHRFERFWLIPVVADRGTIVEASTGIVLSMLPLHLYARRRVGLHERLEEQAAEFLALYASISASSRSSYEALMRAAEMIGPPLGRSLEQMARLYMVTGSIQEAYEEATLRLPRRVRILLRSIVTVARSGGNPSKIISTAAAHAREMRRLARITRNRLSEYTFVVALASATFAVASGVVLALLETMQNATLPATPKARIEPEIVRGMYYYSLMIIVFASSIVIARIIYGHIELAAKYIAILTFISTLAFLLSPLLITRG